MIEYPGIDRSDFALPETLTDPSRYLNEFEERLAGLHPFRQHNRKTSKRLEAGGIEIVPDKFAPILLWSHDNIYDVLLGKDTESSYEPLDHSQIANEYKVVSPNGSSGFILASGNSRFLTFALSKELDRYSDTLQVCLKKYKITAIIIPKINFSNLSIKVVKDGFFIAAENYEEVLDNLVRDDWTSCVAQRYGLTNTELLRLRLQGYLPDGKNKLLPKEDEFEKDFNLTQERYMRIFGIPDDEDEAL